MSSPSFHTQHIQRRFIRILLAITVIVILVGTPLLLLDDLRLDIAHQLGLAPGKAAEKLAEGDEGAVLIILPLGDYQGVGREQYAYEAAFIARPSAAGMTLTDIETGQTIDVPLTELAFTAADSDGEHILFRGPAAEDTALERAVLLKRDDASVTTLPDAEATPDIPGDWETQTWEKVVGTCDRISPNERFIACFNRAEVINYFAGDWQVDVQIYGEFKVSEPVYRGMGFWPVLGFAHNDEWLYFQNDTGIYRIQIPESLREYDAAATPTGTTHNPADHALPQFIST